MALGRLSNRGKPSRLGSRLAVELAPRHSFYDWCNEILAEAEFDEVVEMLCQPYYSDGVGRPSVPPGRYFRMLFVGQYEGLGSEREIAWRCADCLSLHRFLRLSEGETVPDHTTLSVTRSRLPIEIHHAVFGFVLEIVERHDLVRGRRIGVDASTQEANAALRRLVRRDTGEDYRQMLERLAEDSGIETPSTEDLIRFDRTRKGKSLSNAEWASPTEAEAMLDLVGRTPTPEDRAEMVADKGYHSREVLKDLEDSAWKSRVAETERTGFARWHGDDAARRAVYNNRARLLSSVARQAFKLRAERVERSFAVILDIGGLRRTWLRGVENVEKRYLIQVAAYNLGLVIRHRFRAGTPRQAMETIWFVFRESGMGRPAIKAILLVGI